MSEQNSDGKEWSRLAKKVWTTKGARFNAQRRLEAERRGSMHTLAVLSIYVIVLQCWLAFDADASGGANGWVWPVLMIGMAVTILVLGLMEENRRHGVEADRLGRSGMDLNRLSDEIAADAVSGEERTWLERRTEEYHDILGRTSENHEKIDYDLVRAQSRDDYDMGWWEGMTIRARYWWRIYKWYMLLVLPWLVFWWGRTGN